MPDSNYKLFFQGDQILNVNYNMYNFFISEKIKRKQKKFLQKNIDIKPKNLKIKLTVNYNRIILYNKKNKEKITIDTDLVFKNNGIEKALPGLVIAEVENNHYSESSEFVNFIRGFNAYLINISKYCTGTALTNPGIKCNRFKYKLLLINKLLDGTNGQL